MSNLKNIGGTIYTDEYCTNEEHTLRPLAGQKIQATRTVSSFHTISKNKNKSIPIHVIHPSIKVSDYSDLDYLQISLA